MGTMENPTVTEIPVWELRELWRLFEQVPLVPEAPDLEMTNPPDVDCTMVDWNQFPKGTHKWDIREWFENSNLNFSTSNPDVPPLGRWIPELSVPQIIPTNLVEKLLELSKREYYRVSFVVEDNSWCVEFSDPENHEKPRRVMKFNPDDEITSATALRDRLEAHYTWVRLLDLLKDQREG